MAQPVGRDGRRGDETVHAVRDGGAREAAGSRRSGQARSQVLRVYAARDRRMARGQAQRTVQTVPARAHGTALRQRQHRVRHPVGDQGMTQSSRRRHHRRRHPRPHRAQYGMNRHRRVQYEATARTVHARILTLGGGSGLGMVRHWPSSSITVALRGNNQWPRKLQILTRPLID